MSGALSSDAQAQSMVEKLDSAEKTFAQISSGNEGQQGRVAARLRSPRIDAVAHARNLSRRRKTTASSKSITAASATIRRPSRSRCAAAYPLAWLRFQGASTVYTDQPERAKKLLNQAIDDFTQSSLAMPDPNLVRENVLGRAYCERELGKYDKTEYAKAIEDFKQIMSEGSGTAQYKAAQQGLATTYAAMGNAERGAEIQRWPGQHAAAPSCSRCRRTLCRDVRESPARRREYHEGDRRPHAQPRRTTKTDGRSRLSRYRQV